MPCAAEGARLSRTLEDRLSRLCTVQARGGTDPAGMPGDLAGIHWEAGHTEDHRVISMAELCYRLRKACADDRLWRVHLLRLEEGGIATRAGRAAVDNHHCGHGMTCLSDRSPR